MPKLSAKTSTQQENVCDIIRHRKELYNRHKKETTGTDYPSSLSKERGKERRNLAKSMVLVPWMN